MDNVKSPQTFRSATPALKTVDAGQNTEVFSSKNHATLVVDRLLTQGYSLFEAGLILALGIEATKKMLRGSMSHTLSDMVSKNLQSIKFKRNHECFKQRRSQGREGCSASDNREQ